MSAEDREQDIVERYPHFKTYQACQSAAFALGSFTFAGVTAGMFFASDYAYKRYKPSVSKNWVIAFPILSGIAVSYVVTMKRTAACSNMWMAMEERHSALTSAQERRAERLKDSSSQN